MLKEPFIGLLHKIWIDTIDHHPTHYFLPLINELLILRVSQLCVHGIARLGDPRSVFGLPQSRRIRKTIVCRAYTKNNVPHVVWNIDINARNLFGIIDVQPKEVIRVGGKPVYLIRNAFARSKYSSKRHRLVMHIIKSISFSNL